MYTVQCTRMYNCTLYRYLCDISTYGTWTTVITIPYIIYKEIKNECDQTKIIRLVVELHPCDMKFDKSVMFIAQGSVI